MNKTLDQYPNPFQAVRDFEKMLEEFTGAPHAIVTDCCTHAMEIALRIEPPKSEISFPGRTYLSVVMLMYKLNLKHTLTDEKWNQSYMISGTRVRDCARYLDENMYVPGEIQCLSFNRGKPLAIGKGGAILTDDARVADRANRMRYDGRDIFKYSPWIEQSEFEVGFHYYLRPEECVVGMELLENRKFVEQTLEMFDYPDCRKIKISA